MNVLVTWMYSSPEGEAIHHAQTGADSGSQEVKNYYWRCVFLLFASSARVNSDIRHLLFVNQMPPDEIDGVSTAKLVEQYKIEIHTFDHITISPSDYYGAWNTQFIVIDLLEQLSTMVSRDDIITILDSDMVFNKPISEEFEKQVIDERALLFTMEYGPSYKINGLSRVELYEIAKEINDDFPAEEFVYSGGEFLCFMGGELGKVANLARNTYQASLDRHDRGLKKFNEEAHLLSYVYHVLGYKNGTANRYLKRIWTDRTTYCNVNGEEQDLLLWHLPAEKKRGFVELFRTYECVSGEYLLETDGMAKRFRIKEPFVEKMGRYYRVVKRKALLR